MMLAKLAVAATLGLTACGEGDDETIDGKTISALDIGGDITIEKGASKQLIANVKYHDGTARDVTARTDLEWHVGDASVATISLNGLITGMDVGTTRITATFRGKSSADHALIVH